MSSKIQEVKLGQVWTDNDKRYAGKRHFTVIAFDEMEDGTKRALVRSNGSVTKIRLSRFRLNSTGYRLVKDV